MQATGGWRPDWPPAIAGGKSAKSITVRSGNWLSLKQAQALLNAPDITTTKGLCDHGIIAVPLGGALRCSGGLTPEATVAARRARTAGLVCVVPAISGGGNALDQGHRRGPHPAQSHLFERGLRPLLVLPHRKRPPTNPSPQSVERCSKV